MHFIISVFRHVLAPLAVIFAAAVGILTAVLSALIEYSVLRQWLQPEGGSSVFLPLILVVCCEGMKLFLNFTGAASRQNRQFSAQGVYSNLFFYIKWGLIMFSFVCSLIFTANAFYYKVPEARTEVYQQAEEEIMAEYESRLQAETAEADKVYEQTLEAAAAPLDNARRYFESITVVYTPRYEYERTLAMKREAQAALEKAQDQYKLDQETAEAMRTSTINAARASLDEWEKQELLALESGELSGITGDNPYLSSFLLFFSETFFDAEYSRGAYFTWVLLISLVLSALMEGIIAISQHVVTMPPAALRAIAADAPLEEKEQRTMSRLLWVAVSLLLAMSVFLVFGAVMEVTYSRLDLGAALVSSLVTVLVPTALMAIQWEDKECKVPRLLADMISEAKTTMIKGIVSFGGFVLIGLAFGESFATLSLPAIGVSVGNSVAHLLHLRPAEQPTAA